MLCDVYGVIQVFPAANVRVLNHEHYLSKFVALFFFTLFLVVLFHNLLKRQVSEWILIVSFLLLFRNNLPNESDLTVMLVFLCVVCLCVFCSFSRVCMLICCFYLCYFFTW